MAYSTISDYAHETIQWINSITAQEFLAAGLPVYDRGGAVHTYTHKWIWFLAYDLGRYIHNDNGKVATREVAFIYHNKALRDKWSSIITLDCNYLLTPITEKSSKPHCRELMAELKLAGYEVSA